MKEGRAGRSGDCGEGVLAGDLRNLKGRWEGVVVEGLERHKEATETIVENREGLRVDEGNKKHCVSSSD